MPTLHRIGTASIRVNTPDHRPAHVHVVLADRRDAMVNIDTLAVTSHHLKAKDIPEALQWIKANQALCHRIFKECNP